MNLVIRSVSFGDTDRITKFTQVHLLDFLHSPNILGHGVLARPPTLPITVLTWGGAETSTPPLL